LYSGSVTRRSLSIIVTTSLSFSVQVDGPSLGEFQKICFRGTGLFRRRFQNFSTWTGSLDVILVALLEVLRSLKSTVLILEREIMQAQACMYDAYAPRSNSAVIYERTPEDPKGALRHMAHATSLNTMLATISTRYRGMMHPMVSGSLSRQPLQGVQQSRGTTKVETKVSVTIGCVVPRCMRKQAHNSCGDSGASYQFCLCSIPSQFEDDEFRSPLADNVAGRTAVFFRLSYCDCMQPRTVCSLASSLDRTTALHMRQPAPPLTHRHLRHNTMEALSFIALAVTVATLAKNLTELLRDGKHVAKYLKETRDDLEDLKGVISQVNELLSRPDMKSNFADSSAVIIVKATHKDFESCQRFILEFLSSNETTSFSSRFKRLAVPNRRKDNYAALNRKITDHIIRAQISLQMLDLHVTCTLPGKIDDLRRQIDKLRDTLEQLSTNVVERDTQEVLSSHASDQLTSDPRTLVRSRSVESLQSVATAVLDEATHALVLWQGNTLQSDGFDVSSSTSRSRSDEADRDSLQSSTRPISSRTRGAPSFLRVDDPTSIRGSSVMTMSRPSSVHTEQTGRRPPSVQSMVHSTNSLSRGVQRPRGKLVAVCGKTGSGKTSFISALAGRDCGIGYDLQSSQSSVMFASCFTDNQFLETSKIHEVEVRLGRETVILVDTPGFSDTNMTDTQVLEKIANWMKDTYSEGQLLSGIVYLHPINQNRMDGPSMQNIKLFRKLCGLRSMRNVILATTMWTTHNQRSPTEFEERERDLKDNYWKDMIDADSRVFRHANTKDSAEMIVSQLLGNNPEKLAIQVELVDERRNLVDTGAGSCVNADLEKLQASHQKEILAIKEELQEGNVASQRERKALLEKLSKTIAKLEQTKIDMQTLHQREMNDLRRANEKQAAQHTQQMRTLQSRIHETEKASAAQADASRKALEDQKKELNRRFDAYKEEIRGKDLQMSQLRQEMREVAISSKKSEENAARMAESLSRMEEDRARLALQEKNISRERDQLLHVINNNNTNNDNSTYNTRNTRFGPSANRSNRSNYSPSMSYDDYGGWDIDEPIRETSRPRGGPTGGPPPSKPTMIRMNPKSKNLHQAFAIREENQRRQRAYERQMDAYYGT
ncbi:hypothetical protein KCU87_g411, partial [Aureobasidium melanogenum]